MSQGRQGKLSATVQQRSQQQQQQQQVLLQPSQSKAPHVPPLWRETATAAGADGLHPANGGATTPVPAAIPTYRSQFERANSRSGMLMIEPGGGSQSARAALESSSGARRTGTGGSMTARMRPPQSSAIGLSVDGEMMGAHLAGNAAAAAADGFVSHRHTHRTTTTTTTILQQQHTTSSETTSSTMLHPSYPSKARALGDGGAMLSYGSDDGPSKYASTFLPSLRSSERDELAQLGEALDYFIERLDASRLRRVRLDDRSSVEQMLALLREEQAVYDLFFDEIIRQVSVQSRERGAVLSKIRTHYAAMLLRLPMHLHAVQSELANQQSLNRTLAEEARQGRERAFQVQVELGAYTHRFKEAAHELEMHRDMLARAEHEKDRARVMFSTFKAEWDLQRAQLEEQVALLQEEREDYLATAGATAAALARSRRPNPIAQSLADESDEDEERIGARLLALGGADARAATQPHRQQQQQQQQCLRADEEGEEEEVGRLSAAMIRQIERDQQKSVEQQQFAASAASSAQQRLANQEAARTSPDAAAAADAASCATASSAAPATEEERRARQAEDRRTHIEAARRAEHARRSAERAAVAAAQSRPATSVRSSAARLPSLPQLDSSPASPGSHRMSLSSFAGGAGGAAEGDLDEEHEAGGFLSSKFIAPSLLGGRGDRRRTTPAEAAEDRRAQAERREAKRVRRSLASSAPAQEALRAQEEILRAWQAGPHAVEETCARLADLLPQIARDEIDRVAVHPKHNGCIPMLVDFLSRVDSYPFNQSELLLLRSSLPTAPGMGGSAAATNTTAAGAARPASALAPPPVALLWSEALTAELARQGLGDVAAALFSKDNARKAYLAALALELSSSSEEEGQEDSPGSVAASSLVGSGAVSAAPTAPQSASISRHTSGSGAELDELLRLVPAAAAGRNPRAESMRRSMEAQADIAASAAAGVVGAAAVVLARDHKAKKKMAREERRNKMQQQHNHEGSTSEAEQTLPSGSNVGAPKRSSRDATGSISTSGTGVASPGTRGTGVPPPPPPSSRRTYSTARTNSRVRSRQGSLASTSTLSASTSVESLSSSRTAGTGGGLASARSTATATATVVPLSSASVAHSSSRPSSPLTARGGAATSRHKSTTSRRGEKTAPSPKKSTQQPQPQPQTAQQQTAQVQSSTARALSMGATLNMLEQDEMVSHTIHRGASLARRSTGGAAVARAEAQSDGEELHMEMVGGTSSGAEQRSLAQSSDDETPRRDLSRRRPPPPAASSTAAAPSEQQQQQQQQQQQVRLVHLHAHARDRHDLPDVLLPGVSSIPAQQQHAHAVPAGEAPLGVAAAVAAPPKRRPSAVDPHAPRSFFEASQLVPVSKVVVAPRGGAGGVGGGGGGGGGAGGRAAVAETPRERELQGVIDDLIAQNELLHAQRQALAAAHGMADTGAPALPASLASSPLGGAPPGSYPAPPLADLTPLAVNPMAHAGFSLADKQNHLLAKVNEYLQAYRAAKKGAALAPGGGGDGAAQHGAAGGSHAAGGAPAQSQSVEPASLPGIGAGATARAVLSGARSLLHNSRFLQLIKGGPSGSQQQRRRAAATSGGDADSEHKETDGGGSVTSRAGKPPAPAAQLSLPWVVRWIRGLYDAKLARDELCRGEGAPLQRLPEFLLEVQRKKYGLESLSHGKTWAVVTAVARLRDSDREVALFAAFLEESRPLDELVLFLRTRAVVQQCTVGIHWAGHVHERPGAVGGAGAGGSGAAAGGAGGNGHKQKCCLEFVSLCRARSVIASIFSSSVALQDAVYRDVLSRAVFWHALPDPIPASKWATLLPGSAIGAGGGGGGAQQAASAPAYAQVDERAVSLVDLCEVVLAQFRAVELRLRHHQWAEELFDSAVNSSRAQAAQQAAMALESSAGSGGGGGAGSVPPLPPLPPPGEERMDFPCFALVFSLAEPRYSSREVAQLYSNVTRNAGLKTLSRPLFKQLIHQLMGEGTMFPLLSQPDYERINTVRMVMRHWSSFRSFLARVLHSLQHSEQTADVEAANNLAAIRAAFEHELSKAASGGGGGPGSEGAASMVGAEGAAAAASSTRRLVALYRGMLHVLLAHQSASQLSMAPPPPLRSLHTELKVLAHVALARQRAIEGRDAAPDAWLEEVAAMEDRAPGVAFGELMAGAHGPFDDDPEHDQHELEAAALH